MHQIGSGLSDTGPTRLEPDPPSRVVPLCILEGIPPKTPILHTFAYQSIQISINYPSSTLLRAWGAQTCVELYGWDTKSMSTL